jgi:hypothetical protein
VEELAGVVAVALEVFYTLLHNLLVQTKPSQLAAADLVPMVQIHLLDR